MVHRGALVVSGEKTVKGESLSTVCRTGSRELLDSPCIPKSHVHGGLQDESTVEGNSVRDE